MNGKVDSRDLLFILIDSRINLGGIEGAYVLCNDSQISAYYRYPVNTMGRLAGRFPKIIF